MAATSISRYFLSLLIFPLFFISTVLAQSSSSSPSFKLKTFHKSKLLDTEITLYGDAKLNKTGSFVQITQSWSYSAGRVMYRKPIKKLGGNGKEKYSFGTHFSFSLSHENGDGLVFVMLPNGFSSKGYNGKLFGLANEVVQKKNRAFFAVEIDTKSDAEFGDINDNHVGIDLGSFVSRKVTNLKSFGLNNGRKIQCWIDYEASSKRIEVRISKSDVERPVSPVLSFPIDLSKVFKNQEVFVGLSSSNANSTQVCKLYSWSFELRQVPYWMHSDPLDPKTFSKEAKPVSGRKRSDCAVKVLMALILGTVCGAFGAYVVMFFWSVFVAKQPVAPEEFVIKPVSFESEKVKVLDVHSSDDVK